MSLLNRLKSSAPLLCNLIIAAILPLVVNAIFILAESDEYIQFSSIVWLILLLPISYLLAIKVIAFLGLSTARLRNIYLYIVLISHLLLLPVLVWLINLGQVPLIFPAISILVFYVGLLVVRALWVLIIDFRLYAFFLISLVAVSLTPFFVCIAFYGQYPIDVNVLAYLGLASVVVYVIARKVVAFLGLSSQKFVVSCFYIDIVAHLFLLPIYWLARDYASLPSSFYVGSFVVFYVCLIFSRILWVGQTLLFNSSPIEKQEATLLRSDIKANADGRTAWIFSFTGVSNEPRVLRQAQALINDGWSVVVLGYDGHSERPAEWSYVRLPSAAPYKSLTYKLLNVTQLIGMFIVLYVPGLKEIGARLYHRGIGNWRYVRSEAIRVLRENSDIKPDLVICHDYFTCDAGFSVAQLADAKFSVDCHEYSTGQYMDNKKWVKYQRPYVIAMQDYFLSKADVVTTVCDGIAKLLDQEHSLQKPVVTVRSVPFQNVQSYRATGEKIVVLYHGDISYARGLHKAIQSMTQWRNEFTLVIRGAGDEKYIKFLRQLAEDEGLKDRVTIEGPVPFDKIIPKANEADIGYFVHRDISPQKRFTLPNKFFEYIMAGVALCVSDLPEMRAIVSKYNCGLLVSDYDEQIIANVINSFDRESINRCKQASLRAAEELNWSSESVLMLEAYDNLFERHEILESAH